jgi:hypothetical protein
MQARIAFSLAAMAIEFATSAKAEAPLEQGFAGALRGCEEWVLNPKSWARGVAPFVATVGLGDKMGLVERVDEASLPPPPLRVANHYWRINSTPNSGFVLVVSDQLPMCHITGGGAADLQPAIEAVLGASAFTSHWARVGDDTRGELRTTSYQSRQDPALSILVSRAKAPGQRTDRVQVLATATYAIGK